MEERILAFGGRRLCDIDVAELEIDETELWKGRKGRVDGVLKKLKNAILRESLSVCFMMVKSISSLIFVCF